MFYTFVVKPTLKISALGLLGLTLVSCTDAESDPPPPATQFPANISAIFEGNCVNCHTEDNVGTFSLLPEEDGWDNAVRFSEETLGAVLSKRMPPFLADNTGQCNSFQNEFPMNAADIQAVSNWISSGLPTDDTGSVSLQAPELPLLDRTDKILTMPEAYTPQGSGVTDNEEGRCFVVDGLDQTKVLTGFEVIPGNTDTVHHVQLYVTNRSKDAEDALGFQNADDIPGYSCYGDVGLGETNASLVATWTPGTGATYYPNDTGILIYANAPAPEPPTHLFIMKVHYLVKQGALPFSDTTSIKLKLEDVGSVTEASIMTLTNDSSTPLDLTANQAEVGFTASAKYGLPYDSEIHAIMPHMHDLGSRVKVEILTVGNPTPNCLVDIPLWDFEWQRFFFYKAPSSPITIKESDTVQISCYYNTSGLINNVIQGSDEGQEHCMAYLYVVPKLL